MLNTTKKNKPNWKFLFTLKHAKSLKLRINEEMFNTAFLFANIFKYDNYTLIAKIFKDF